MTTAAQPWNVHRVYIGSGILDFLGAVAIVADKAGGNIHITLDKFRAVDTHLVLGVLVGWNVILAHQFDPCVTARAQRRNILGLGCSGIARRLGHCLFFSLFRRVSAVAV